MKKSFVFCFLLMQLGKTSWSSNISVTTATNLAMKSNITQANGTNVDGRRRRPRPGGLLKSSHNKYRIEDYYEPYNEGGEIAYIWKPKVPSKKPKQYPTVEPTESTPYSIENITDGKEMQKYRDCNAECPGIYQDIFGIVCGFRFNTITYKNEYKSFNDLCELQYYNCQYPQARPMFHLIHRGPCPELTTFRNYPGNTQEAIDRADSWLNRSFVLVTQKKSRG